MVAFVGFIAALVVAMVIACLHQREFDDKCTSAGGFTRDTNCHTTYVPMSCGSDCTIITPIENCDHVCVSSRPEIPR